MNSVLRTSKQEEENKKKRKGFFQRAGKFLGQYAPVAGKLLLSGTPVGGLVSSLCDIVGAKDDDPEDLLSKLETADAETLAKIKKYEFEHKSQLQNILLDHEELKIKERKLQMADTDSARQREVAIVQATGKKDFIQQILILTTMAGFLLVVVAAVFGILPTEDEVDSRMLFFVIGQASTGFMVILNYYFGSSMGSRLKDAQSFEKTVRDVK